MNIYQIGKKLSMNRTNTLKSFIWFYMLHRNINLTCQFPTDAISIIIYLLLICSTLIVLWFIISVGRMTQMFGRPNRKFFPCTYVYQRNRCFTIYIMAFGIIKRSLSEYILRFLDESVCVPTEVASFRNISNFYGVLISSP